VTHRLIDEDNLSDAGDTSQSNITRTKTKYSRHHLYYFAEAVVVAVA
jgi:hypothetical protein